MKLQTLTVFVFVIVTNVEAATYTPKTYCEVSEPPINANLVLPSNDNGWKFTLDDRDEVLHEAASAIGIHDWQLLANPECQIFSIDGKIIWAIGAQKCNNGEKFFIKAIDESGQNYWVFRHQARA